MQEAVEGDSIARAGAHAGNDHRISALRYAPPARRARSTRWAVDWRRRWFAQVGTVVEHWPSHELMALYSGGRDPAARIGLQEELEARPGGIGQVIAACRAARRIALVRA